MKQLIAIETEEQLPRLKEAGNRLFQQLMEYKEKLQDEFELNEMPEAVLWTTTELVTTTFSKIPIPALTSRNMVVMSPDIQEWKTLFLEQLEDRVMPDVVSFYENLSEVHLLVILAHELTHHIDLFPDEFEEYEDAIWFEEGMCFYLPRKLLLTDKEFNEITLIEEKLVDEFSNKYGKHDLNKFGSTSYEGSLTSIMYDYWRSYLKVKDLVENCANGDVHRVLGWYNEWYQAKREVAFSQYITEEKNTERVS